MELTRIITNVKTKRTLQVAIVAVFVLLPLLVLLWSLGGGPGEMWTHVTKHLLGQYVVNSIVLIFGCASLAVLIGVSSAWILSSYSSKYSFWLHVLMLLPLAMPSYITAYAYYGLLGHGGFLDRIAGVQLDPMNIWGLMIVLSLSLYPYVYITTRIAIRSVTSSYISSSLLLNGSRSHFFWKIVMPLCKPAISAGLIFVIMELLNDYGAADYYNVKTFTTGIFRTWFQLEDRSTALYLSIILLLIVLVFYLLDMYLQSRRRYAVANKDLALIDQTTYQTPMKTKHFVIVFIPILLGFIIPVLQLVYWAWLALSKEFLVSVLHTLWQSVLIAFITAVVVIVVAILLIFLSRWSQGRLAKYIARSATIGYAVPGAIIALGAIIMGVGLQKWFSIGVQGTLLILIWAYVTRFATIAYNPIRAKTLQLNDNLGHASRLLGVGPWKTLWQVHIPLLMTSMSSVFLLLFIDLLKELPLTLILKPYSWSTLSIRAYEYASDEMIVESGLPSLTMVFAAAIAIIVVEKRNRK